ncbi:MAG: tetraacyldisaccharide 4'-kinase [Candidatus Omnitrophota bacterium]|jgi:tetraacyldisaccharide 4'-kinase
MKEYLYNLATDKYRGFPASFLQFFLLLASFLYGIIIRGLVLFYKLRPAQLSCKVISIGNITLGGTGKTSLVEFVSRYLKAKGHNVAVLSRGYNRLGQEMGDEPSMLSKSLGDIPVIVGHNRIKGAQRAIKEYAVDTVILDDGMQQWRIKKNLEIVTISSKQGFGNRHMLPRGILRQPLSSLGEADIFVLTKTDLSGSLAGIKGYLSKVNPQALIVESVHEALGFYAINNPDEIFSLNHLKGKDVVLFSGIGDPDSFNKLIANLGVNIGLDLIFDDHHNYSEEDLTNIASRAQTLSLNIIITTEKDAARLSEEKLKPLKGFQVLVLRVALKITKNEEPFFARLLSLYTF